MIIIYFLISLIYKMNIVNKQNKLKELYNIKTNKEDILKELNISNATFYRWIKKLNIKNNDVSNNDNISEYDFKLDISKDNNSIIKNTIKKNKNNNKNLLQKYTNRELLLMLLSNNKKQIKDILNEIIVYIDKLDN